MAEQAGALDGDGVIDLHLPLRTTWTTIGWHRRWCRRRCWACWKGGARLMDEARQAMRFCLPEMRTARRDETLRYQLDKIRLRTHCQIRVLFGISMLLKRT